MTKTEIEALTAKWNEKLITAELAQKELLSKGYQKLAAAKGAEIAAIKDIIRDLELPGKGEEKKESKSQANPFDGMHKNDFYLHFEHQEALPTNKTKLVFKGNIDEFSEALACAMVDDKKIYNAIIKSLENYSTAFLCKLISEKK